MRKVSVSATLMNLVGKSFALMVPLDMGIDEIKAQVLQEIERLADEYTAPAHRRNGLGLWHNATMIAHDLSGTVNLWPSPERDAGRL